MPGFVGTELGAGSYLRTGIANYVHGHDLLLRLFYERFSAWTFAAYVVWLVICILSTLDSGYIALRWFLQANAAASKSPIFSLIPESVIASPIPVFIFAGLFALFASVVKLELEYFMIFCDVFRRLLGSRHHPMLHEHAQCHSAGQDVLHWLPGGCYLRIWILPAPSHPADSGFLLPLALVIWLIFKPGSSQEFIGDSRALSPVSEIPMPPEEEERRSRSPPRARRRFGSARKLAPKSSASPPLPLPNRTEEVAPEGTTSRATSKANGSCIHLSPRMPIQIQSATSTLEYAMWVGKTRELFFNKVLPRFNIKETPFYILTRSLNTSLSERPVNSRVTVRLRISDWNRKFVTLEHEVKDSSEQLLGRGKQTLLFVSSDYSMIDLPADIAAAFVNYA